MTSIFLKKVLQQTLLNNVSVIFIESKAKYATRITEVGKLEPPKKSENYATGQLFLHKVFAYRGVVLFPWVARVYDRDNPTNKQERQVTDSASSKSTTPAASSSSSSTSTPSSSSASSSASATSPASPPPSASSPPPSATSTSSKPSSSASSTSSSSSSADEKEVKGRSHTFYQVLIDTRDCPFIRAQTEAVTFLGNQEGSRSLYAIPGLDYVSHDDILPYTTKEKNPIHHELFDKFLTPAASQEPPYVAQDTLKAWQKKNHPWLELSDVHKETTDSIRITVIPFYMGSRDNQSSLVYWWRYCIRMENLGTKTVQLRERHWRIFSLSGTLETVRGRGVVGHEPVLSPATPAFQYSSHVSLQAPSGHMWGTFRMEREDGYTFDCRIPPFSLESKTDEENPNPPSFGA